MALALYLIGAAGSGKSAVFDALTLTPQGPHFTSKGAHRIGTVKVPDDRLARLRDLYQPKKYTPAEVTFVDVAMPHTTDVQTKLGALIPFLIEADAFVIVVQAFGDMDGTGHALDPARQLESVLLELVVSDLEKVERRVEKIEHERRRGTKQTPETEIRLIEQCKQHLEADGLLRDLPLTDEDKRVLRSGGFLSQKPALVVANVAEDRLNGTGLESLPAVAATRKLDLLRFCAPLEAEIAQLDAGAQAEFLKDYGLQEPASTRLIQAAYRLLDLVSFFTVGEDEVRAWTLRRGTNAHKAAGKIHTDIERGFIRAETVACSHLLEGGSWAACRDNATLRLEGKTYEVADGDVINFRFNA